LAGSPLILAVVQEMLSQELIENSAKAESVDCLVVSDEDVLLAALQEGTPEVLLMDMGISSLDGPSLIQKIKQNPSTRRIPIVAFGNSLRADLLQDAKEMGADLVLPKSAFREQIAGIIRHYSKP